MKSHKLLDTVDVVVAGGSATGVIAAVAAARLGCKVYIIEGQGYFGGVATAGLVTIWHQLYSEDKKIKVISGITEEIIERLHKRNAVLMKDKGRGCFILETEDLKLVLDDIIVESKVKFLLHTLVTDVVVKKNGITGVIIENKSGRQLIKAKQFIDATGDGDVAALAGCKFEKSKKLMPPTMCVRLANWPEKVDLDDAARKIFQPKYKKLIPTGFLWGSSSLTRKGEVMIAGTRVFGVDSTNGRSLSDAEVEGRRQVKELVAIIKKEIPACKNISIAALPSYIGLRESRRMIGKYWLTAEDLLSGKKFDDAIANGSYPIDIHHSKGGGITFYRLSGMKEVVEADTKRVRTRWLPEGKILNYYQIPFRCLIPSKINNLLVTGRCISVDKTAFGATRVMVNCNQTGQAAGVAAALAVKNKTKIAKLDINLIRNKLKKQGAVII